MLLGELDTEEARPRDHPENSNANGPGRGQRVTLRDALLALLLAAYGGFLV